MSYQINAIIVFLDGNQERLGRITGISTYSDGVGYIYSIVDKDGNYHIVDEEIVRDLNLDEVCFVFDK